MKIRTGFVSNSSSSSFVCSVCNRVEEGYDGQYGFDTSYCDVGHEFCSSHLGYLKKIPQEDKLKLALENKYFSETLKDEEVALAKKGNSFAIDDIVERFMDYAGSEVPESICPVCSLTSISDKNMAKYLLKQCGKTEKEVEAEIKNKYNTIKELREGLKK